MSALIPSGNATGTGTMTLLAPPTNGTQTITLPDTTGTVATLNTPSFLTTIGVGGTTASASGAGISFPSTQSASSDANTLDDYEEGTWTPTLTFNGGTTGITYSSRTGAYTKTGNQVTVWFSVTLSSKGSSTGNAYISGLPFSANSGTSLGHGPLDLNGGMTGQTVTGGYGIAAGTFIYFRYNGTTGYTDFGNGVFTNTSTFIGCATYQTS